MTTSIIPTIDIGPYLDGTDKAGVARQIASACETIGFFLVQNHGLDPQSLVAPADDFFRQSVPEKQKCTAPFGLGYMGQGTENVAATRADQNDDVTVQDYKESLNLTLPVRNEVWPPDEKLRHVAAAYYQGVQALATKLMRLFALALQLDEHYFDNLVDEPYTTLRLLHYPAFHSSDDPTGPKTIQTRNAPHTDYGTLTLLWSPDSRGLQAQTRQGEWIDVIAPPDCLIVNLGDLMMNWTNDSWVSTLHRVVPVPGQTTRFSVPFFHNPNPDALIQCIPSCLDSSKGETPKYAPLLAKTHLENKVSQALGQEETMAS